MAWHSTVVRARRGHAGVRGATASMPLTSASRGKSAHLSHTADAGGWVIAAESHGRNLPGVRQLAIGSVWLLCGCLRVRRGSHRRGGLRGAWPTCGRGTHRGGVHRTLLEIKEGSGQPPQGANDPLCTLPQRGHGAGRLRGVAGGSFQLLFRLLGARHRGAWSSGQIAVEDHLREQRHPIVGGVVAAFPSDGTDGEPSCGGAERGLDRDDPDAVGGAIKAAINKLPPRFV